MEYLRFARTLRFALTGALLFCPAVAAADPPPPIPYAPAPREVRAAPAPEAPRLRYKRHSLALMAGGLTLTALGVLSIIGGATAIAEDLNPHNETSGLGTLLGIGLLIHGAGCLAGGIPMAVIGNRSIPAGWAGVLPTLSVGKTSTLRWTF
jgi:hypothetical protein